MTIPDTGGVQTVILRLRELLQRARQLKPRSIEPPLPPSEFSGELGLASRRSNFPTIELAARRLFEELVVGTLEISPLIRANR